MYFLSLPDCRNRPDTARGATNSKRGVIRVDVFDDIDNLSAVGGELLPPGRGANTMLPAFLRPEVLSHRVPRRPAEEQPQSNGTCRGEGGGTTYLRALGAIREDRSSPLSHESQTPHADGPCALAERRGTAAAAVVVGTVPAGATPIIDESHVLNRMEEFALRPAHGQHPATRNKQRRPGMRRIGLGRTPPDDKFLNRGKSKSPGVGILGRRNGGRESRLPSQVQKVLECQILREGWRSMILGGCRQGGAAPRGGMVGEVEGYLWMPWRSENVRGEEEAAVAVGGAMPKQKWCVMCLSTFLLGTTNMLK